MRENCKIKYRSKFVFHMSPKILVNMLDIHNFFSRHLSPLKGNPRPFPEILYP